MYQLLKPILFLFDPEKVHHVVFKALRIILKIPFVKSLVNKSLEVNHSTLQRQVFGLSFKNPVGLAAGFDKDGVLYHELSALGFGFLELGTVTPQPQPGNDKKRLFRLKEDQAIINRMGFNNQGVDALVERLKKGKPDNVIIGGNIGKNKWTPNEKAIDDYVICFNKLFDWVDYFVVNVSSPNTPNLRDLQDKEPLTRLLSALQDLNAEKTNPKPILLKIAPDLIESQLDDIIEMVSETKIAGVIATNTTLDRKGLKSSHKNEMGGLSGQPLKEKSTEVIKYLHQKSGGAFPIIGVGGIHSAQDAIDKIEAGASLIQLYTGFVYEGPSLIKSINKALTT